ncbi:hypothetical protein TraAM80_04235 [Trypanosoma rangeli]|uniref:Uncharacterized protein n=1 Tax=Trypanosoma rangeli TaxID=5698 RepID=A0A422NKX7_TRYRA|nr:uncharacterized protein TraAM80_04235 [Trypanosoma rangeli]RNF05989.1 hypothetical protein TraAM80_04235 [Trypanosoma rangeli]|eukprot:RNF05989.1 hypothetical protein TraAM80_04235 [Trypanosoma rangeli]
MSTTSPRRAVALRRRVPQHLESLDDSLPSRITTRRPSVQNGRHRISTARSSLMPSVLQRRIQRDAELVLEESLWHLCGENVEETMDKLLGVISIRRGGPLTPRKGRPLWQRVQAIVVIANQEGIRRMLMATPSERVRFFFDKSLSILELPSKKRFPWRQDEFAAFPSLRKHLVGTTLNNKAVLQHTAGDSPQLVVQTLQRALREQGTAFATTVLYNLAVTMVSVQRFDLASDFIACCSELVEACLRIDISDCPGVLPLCTEYHTNIATHAIMCHHLVAALAAWCSLQDVERYHCQLAVCCAQRYLDPKSLIAIRCRQRLAAAREGSGAFMMSEAEPPRLPMLHDDLSLVRDSLFIVLLERAGKMPTPPRLANCIAQFLSFDLSLDTQKAVRLPPLKAKRRHLVEQRQAPTVQSKRTSSQRQRSLLQGRSSSNLKDKKGLRAKTESESSVMTSTLLETFRKERAATPPREDDLFGVDFVTRPETPPLITFVPKPAFHCYKHLRKELRRLMCELGKEARVAMSTTTTTGAEFRESLNGTDGHGSIVSESRMASPDPESYMRVMDKKLRHLSRLLPDEEFERKECATVTIQSFWRGVVDRREYHRRLLPLHEAMLRREAAEVIQHAFRNYRATREPIQMKRALRAHRILVQHIVRIQSYLYCKKSVEEVGERTVVSLQRLIAAMLEARRRNAAVVRLQSLWRMCRVWSWLRRTVTATQTIQRVWRGHRGRLRAREARVCFRLEEQRRIARHTAAVCPIQRWWKSILLLRACKAIVAHRQRELAAYLAAEEQKFSVEWERIKHVPNVELCIQKVLSVLRGFRCREELAHQQKFTNILRRFLLRMVWKKRLQRCLQRLKEERQETRALRRRREEVMDATIRIQCVARRWLASRVRTVLWDELQRKHHQARVIQRAYRRCVGRRLIHSKRAEAAFEEERRMVDQLIKYSASKIQATWRMHSVRQSQAEFLNFLRRDRHVFASRIQKAWRTYKARCQSDWLRLSQDNTHRLLQEQQLQLTAAIRIQSVGRMFLVRQQLLREGVTLWPTPAFMHRCARTIQSAWRRHAAYEYVQQLCFSRAYYDQQKINMETLHVYATTIQSLVRAKILNPRRVAARRLEVEYNEDHKRKREDAMRLYYDAITSQDDVNGTSALVQPPPAEPLPAVETQECVPTAVELEPEPEPEPEPAAEEAENVEVLVQLVQRCGRGALARCSVFDVVRARQQEVVESPLEAEAEAADEGLRSPSAVITSQEDVNGTSALVQPPPAEPLPAVETQECVPTAVEPELELEPEPEPAAEEAENVEVFVQLVQRCGRGALARCSMFDMLRAHPRWKAAVDVQRVWRGYCSRQLVEVYYEFYTDDV